MSDDGLGSIILYFGALGIQRSEAWRHSSIRACMGGASSRRQKPSFRSPFILKLGCAIENDETVLYNVASPAPLRTESFKRST